MATHDPCPCGNPTAYANCCGRLHLQFQQTGQLGAGSAEQLMRSRYSAFVRNDTGYLLASWHPRTRPAMLAPNEGGLRWLGLEIKQHLQQDANHATVQFVARSKLGGRAHRLCETSRFEKVDGQWYYLDGDV